MLPPRLIRRLVLAPLVIVIGLAFLVLSPFLALPGPGVWPGSAATSRPHAQPAAGELSAGLVRRGDPDAGYVNLAPPGEHPTFGLLGRARRGLSILVTDLEHHLDRAHGAPQGTPAVLV